jgi:hypothetical protein
VNEKGVDGRNGTPRPPRCERRERARGTGKKPTARRQRLLADTGSERNMRAAGGTAGWPAQGTCGWPAGLRRVFRTVLRGSRSPGRAPGGDRGGTDCQTLNGQRETRTATRRGKTRPPLAFLSALARATAVRLGPCSWLRPMALRSQSPSLRSPAGQPAVLPHRRPARKFNPRPATAVPTAPVAVRQRAAVAAIPHDSAVLTHPHRNAASTTHPHHSALDVARRHEPPWHGDRPRKHLDGRRCRWPAG